MSNNDLKSVAQKWRERIAILSSVDPTPIDIARTCIPGSEIDDSVVSAFFRSLPTDNLTCLPVGFSTELALNAFPSHLQYEWHTPCVAFTLAVGGSHDVLDKDHYVLAIVDRDFREVRLYNSIDGYDDLKFSFRLLFQLGFAPSTFRIRTNISEIQERGSQDCGRFVCINAAREAHHPAKYASFSRLKLASTVSSLLGFGPVLSPCAVKLHDRAQSNRHTTARCIENSLIESRLMDAKRMEDDSMEKGAVNSKSQAAPKKRGAIESDADADSDHATKKVQPKRDCSSSKPKDATPTGEPQSISSAIQGNPERLSSSETSSDLNLM